MVSQRTYNIPAVRTILLGIFFLIIGLQFWLRYTYAQRPREQNFLGWPCTECTIKKIDVDNTVEKTKKDKNHVRSHINVFFEYEFGGRTYTNNQSIRSDILTKPKYLAVYQPGKKMTCYVNPNKFKEARLYDEIADKDHLPLLVIPAIFGILSLCFIIHGIIKLKTDT